MRTNIFSSTTHQVRDKDDTIDHWDHRCSPMAGPERVKLPLSSRIMVNLNALWCEKRSQLAVPLRDERVRYDDHMRIVWNHFHASKVRSCLCERLVSVVQLCLFCHGALWGPCAIHTVGRRLLCCLSATHLSLVWVQQS